MADSGGPQRKVRSFVDHKLEKGTAEKLRDQVKEAFALPDGPQVLGPTLNFVGGPAAFEVEESFAAAFSLGPPTSSVDPVNPVDYERFISENADIIKGDPQPHLLLFPDGDVSVSSVQRKFRTIQYPVPGQAKRTDDPLVRDCVKFFTQDWNKIERKFGSFHGNDESSLDARFSTCKRTPEYAKSLPVHVFEVDMAQNQQENEERKSQDELKKLYRQSVQSNVEYNLESAESDGLLLNLLDTIDDQVIDDDNHKERSTNRHPALFGLYPLPGREEALENRTPTVPPAEHEGIKLLVKISELRFDLEVEPIFASVALYDVREKRKISESFHLDCNSGELIRMLDDYTEERSMASTSRSGIFNITYPHSDIFLVIKIEKVLQQGDIGDAADPYFRGHELDRKSLDKVTNNARLYCKQLGQYRMPFAWAAINIIDLITGNQASGSSPHTSVVTQDGGGGTRERKDTGTSSNKRDSTATVSSVSTQERKGGIGSDQLRRKDGRSGSLTSQTSRSAVGGAEESGSDEIIHVSQNFPPVTLTLNLFIKQEGDKLKDEDLFRLLSFMRKPATDISKRFKIIPGHLKMDIQPPYEGIPCCLTSNLFEVDPFPDNRTRRPIRELEEFPSREVYAPYTTYKNFLYVYPQSLDFRSVNKRNIGIKVQFMGGEEREDVLPAIYGRSSGPAFLREWWCLVHYHNKQPEFYEEIKIELPPKITDKHHLLFKFYHVSCQKPKPDVPLKQEPIFLGCTWIPLLQGMENKELKLGDYNLAVTADNPPAAYSQLSSDVHLPNLKWVDNHRPVFKVHLKMISSIYPQDTHLHNFLKHYYSYSHQLAIESEEKVFAGTVRQIEQSMNEPTVQFLHLLLNNLCQLLVRPTVTKESAEVPRASFSSLANIIQRVHELRLPCDKHSRDITLSSYIQYVFASPVTPSNHSAFDPRNAISQRSGSFSSEDDAMRRSASLRHSRHMVVQGSGSSPPRPDSDHDMTDLPSPLSVKKLFYEELVFSWITAHPATRASVYGNAWFFFELIIKSMAQHLQKSGKLEGDRKSRFSEKFLKDTEILIGMVSSEVAEKHIKDVQYARKLNTSLAFFIHDCFSLLDRGFSFSLIKCYLKKFALAPADFNLTEFKLDFYRIVCSHEHYVILNLPLGAQLYPMTGSQASSPSGSICSNFDDLGVPNMESMGELSQDFRHYHYLSGLVLAELAHVLEGKNSKLREQSVEVLRDLLASHDSDVRYLSDESRCRISSIYLPLLSIVMDNYHRLYKGADGWENLTNTFDRNTEVRRSVVIKEGSDGSLEIDDEEGRYDQILGPASTRNLLICVLWVLKNIDPLLIKHYWATLSISRLNLFLNVLDLSVACFEYKGKKNLLSQSSGIQTNNSKNSNMKDQLANAILSGVGTAKERLQRRRQTQDPSGSLRWGKTVWQANTEYTEKPKVDIEVDAMIEASLAGEVSLTVLDTLELMIVNTFNIENLQSVLGKNLEVLLHLMLCNQSLEVSKCVFATQRSIVRKFPELIFYEETEQCAELCARLLKHCSSSMSEVRGWACASLYLLMRQNYEIGSNFARVKVQVTVALSSIVAGSTKSFNEHHLRRSLKTLILYADEDHEMSGTPFPEQVRELAINLHRILLDTVKMKSFHNDHEMLMDLMYRISKGYQTSPDLRLTWLQNMAKQHNEKEHYTESAMCLTHAAALVAEYLYMLEGSQHLPVGCVTFQKISPNMLEESAISDDVINPDEEGIATSRLFTESGLIGLLEQAAPMFRESQLYEAAAEIYKLVIPLYENRRKNHSLESVYNKLSDCYKSLAKKGERRFLGSYFRVGFYGHWFGDLHMKEFIYKEEALMKLSEFSLKLETLYGEQLGTDKVEIIKDSNEVNFSKLDGSKAHIQVTYVEPYFEDWELKTRQTVFDKQFNIRRFFFSTPFTPGGKAHGGLHEQWMKRTVLTIEKSFPYVKRRLEVIKTEKSDLEPLEVAIMNMASKISDLKRVLDQTPSDAKLLQMQLQGGIATAVNQGPFAIAKCFLEDVPLGEQTYLHHKLKVCFKEFTKRCQEALERNEELIGEEQYDYQRELTKNFKNFQMQLQPMVSTQKKASHGKKARERALMNISTVRQSRTSQAD